MRAGRLPVSAGISGSPELTDPVEPLTPAALAFVDQLELELGEFPIPGGEIAEAGLGVTAASTWLPSTT